MSTRFAKIDLSDRPTGRKSKRIARLDFEDGFVELKPDKPSKRVLAVSEELWPQPKLKIIRYGTPKTLGFADWGWEPITTMDQFAADQMDFDELRRIVAEHFKGNNR